MATIKNLRDAWRNLDTNKAVQASLERTQANFIEIQKSQLYAGFNVAGIKLGDLTPYASAAYAIDKANRNSLPGLGNPDLYDTGSFYEGITTEVGDDAIKVLSTDSKDPALEKKYPGAVAGLGGPFMVEYIKVLQPTLIKTINASL